MLVKFGQAGPRIISFEKRFLPNHQFKRHVRYRHRCRQMGYPSGERAINLGYDVTKSMLFNKATFLMVDKTSLRHDNSRPYFVKFQEFSLG